MTSACYRQIDPFLAQIKHELTKSAVTFMPALLYIRDHLDQTITLEDIATTMGQSPEHFARAFRDALKKHSKGLPGSHRANSARAPLILLISIQL